MRSGFTDRPALNTTVETDANLNAGDLRATKTSVRDTAHVGRGTDLRDTSSRISRPRQGAEETYGASSGGKPTSYPMPIPTK